MFTWELTPTTNLNHIFFPSPLTSICDRDVCNASKNKSPHCLCTGNVVTPMNEGEIKNGDYVKISPRHMLFQECHLHRTHEHTNLGSVMQRCQVSTHSPTPLPTPRNLTYVKAYRVNPWCTPQTRSNQHCPHTRTGKGPE